MGKYSRCDYIAMKIHTIARRATGTSIVAFSNSSIARFNSVKAVGARKLPGPRITIEATITYVECKDNRSVSSMGPTIDIKDWVQTP